MRGTTVQERRKAAKNVNDIVKAIETVQDMLDVLETAGSCYVYKHNGGADRLRNVLDCLSTQQEQESNDPLTLDELRKMDREPVYIWYPYPKYGEWVVSDGFNQYKNFTSTDNDSWYIGDYGKTWLAYRHKPEEGTA